MKYIISIIFILNSTFLNSQVKEIYQLKDTILVVGEKYTDDVSQQKVNIEEYHSSGLANYDLMSALRIIGINAAFDFNTIPYMEGADFQEQQFFINNIPVPFQSRLIGMQSGLNSLLFSQISLLETHSLNGYSKPIRLELKTNKIDTSQIHFNSKINILHFENTISLPVNFFNGGITVGYNRSLLETIKPFLGSSINNKNDFEYKKFPFFQSFQMLAELKFSNLIIKPIFIYSEDIGNFGINTKGFNFNSYQLNYGAEIQADLGKVRNSTQFYSNVGKNNIDYRFPENKGVYVHGKANLSFEEFGLNSNIEYSIKPSHSFILSLGYKHQKTNSANEVSITNNENSIKASYLSDVFESIIYYQNLLSDKLLSTLHIGLNSFRFYNIHPFLGFDIAYYNPILFNARFQISYESFQEPINPVFYSFQNALWDPSSASSIFFVDDNKLPLRPIYCLNSSINISKDISNSFFETNVSAKLFLRKLKNLVYTNNYPNEVTIYNSDFEFNQDFDGLRYGLSFLLENEIKSLSVKNLIAVNLCKSINRNNKDDTQFYTLNYNPLTITNLVQYQFSNFYMNVLFVYSSGRYMFDKKISSDYSSVDSTVNNSVSTDFTNQLNLKPYYSIDISFLYKVAYSDFDINVSFTFLNIFNHKNESRRIFALDAFNKTLTERSEYYNFPRFFIFEISMNLIL